MARDIITTTALIILSPIVAEAKPQTIAVPAISVQGTSEGSRFGESLSCSDNAATTGGRSVIAVGAPHDATSAGAPQLGAVFIIDLDSWNAPIVQRLESPSPEAGGEFGKAIAFINDINGDSVQDLVVSQPSGTEGRLFVFASSISEDGRLPSYGVCGSFTGPAFLGDTLTAVPPSVGSVTTIIAGSPRSSVPSTDGFAISFSSGECQVSHSPEFTAVGVPNSHFGASLGLIARTNGSPGESFSLLVGAPHLSNYSNFSGQVRTIGRLPPPTATPTAVASPSPTPSSPMSLTAQGNGYVSTTSPFVIGAENDMAGAALATSLDASVFGFGSPGFDNGRGKVGIANTNGGLVCTVTKSDEENSIGLGSSLRHLGTTFEGRVLSDGRTFATFRSEPSTGGSVGLFGVKAPTKECSTTLVQLNNCRADSLQEQGYAIDGGSTCTFTQGSETRSLILVGSPGAAKRGMVDIYVDKSFLESPRACENSDGSGSDFRPPAPTLDAFPGSTGLPSPNLTISRGTDVKIAMPRLKATFKGKPYKDALRRLVKAGFSTAEAIKALKNVTVLYSITISDVEATSKGAGVAAFGTRGRQPPIKKIRTRRDRVTVRFLATPQVRTYAIAYRAEFVVPRPKHVVLGATAFSRTAKIAIGG